MSAALNLKCKYQNAKFWHPALRVSILNFTLSFLVLIFKFLIIYRLAFQNSIARGTSNLMVTKIEAVINNIKNMIVNVCSILTETGFLDIPSIIKNNNFPPSSAGIGSMLKNANTTESEPIKYKKNPAPRLAACDKNIVIPI